MKVSSITNLIFLMSSLVDLFGIGLIGGYVGIIIDPSLVKTIQEMFPAFDPLVWQKKRY